MRRSATGAAVGLAPDRPIMLAATSLAGPRGAPHSPQNRSPCSTADPQRGQAADSGRPQPTQNFLPGRFSVRQLEQTTIGEPPEWRDVEKVAMSVLESGPAA